MIVNDVSKSLGGQDVLCKIDLELKTGQTTVLIGPSGCGKTTLLKVMVGLIWPDSGHVAIDSQNLRKENVQQLRHRFGYVIQEGGLFPHFSARGNATLMARYLKWSSNRISARLAELVKLTQFPEQALDRFPSQLSGGQRQRVSLMRALFLDPDYLFLDEPLGSLDPMIRSDLQADLRNICRLLKKTVVLVTHDLYEATFFADEVVLMRDGHIEQQGTATEILSRPVSPFAKQFVRAQRHHLEPAAGNPVTHPIHDNG